MTSTLSRRILARVVAGLLFAAAGTAHADEPLLLGLATSINDPLAVYAAAQSIGAASVRVDAPWKTIETGPGQYALPAALDERLKAMAAAHLEPLVILDYGHPEHGKGAKPLTPDDRKAYAAYASWVVTALKGRVRYFEVWNEWETKLGGGAPGTAEDYVALARETVPRLRSANPQAVILSAGMSYPAIKTDYFDRFLKAGGPALFDGISIHPYEGVFRKDWTPERAMALLDGLEAKLQAQAGGKSKDLYVTEMGYSTFSSEYGFTPKVVGAFLRRFVLMADARPWLRGVWWYQLRDQGNDASNKENRFGLFDEQLHPKAAAQAFEAAAKTLGRTRGRVRTQGNAVIYDAADGRTSVKWNELDAHGQPFPRNGPDADRDLDAGGEPASVQKAN